MTLRLWLRLAAIAPALLIGVPAQMLAAKSGSALVRTFPRWFHRYLAYVLGMRVTVRGDKTSGPVLYLANHISWLDIISISAVLPVSFIARADMAGWPVFGWLARLQRSIFVDRERRHSTGSVAQMVTARLAAGDAIVLFAEGTTSDGNRVLTFRSALVGAAGTDAGDKLPPVDVRPLSVSYVRRNGLPITRRDMPDVAWYGDMELLPHLKALVGGGQIDAVVSVGGPMRLDHPGDRKRVATQAEEWVRLERGRLSRYEGFEDSAGRL